jgi:putative phosphoesterase
MIKVGVLSDTHLNRPTDDFKVTIGKIFSDVDMIIHAGDMTGVPVNEFLSNWDLRAVSGNMDDYDLRAILPARRIENVSGRRIGIMHGGGSPFGLDQLVLRSFEDVDIIIFGHSHIPMYSKKGDIYLINPGSYKTSKTAGILELEDVINFNLLKIE